MALLKIDPDSPIMSFFGRIFDLVLLQVLVLISCIPVVTIGAAMTAMYSVCRKLHRDSVTSVAGTYYEEFKSNFKKATIVWLILMGISALCLFDLLYYWSVKETFVGFPQIVAILVSVFVYLELVFVFPIMSCFDNNVKAYLRNAPYMALRHFPITIMVTVMYGLILYFFREVFPVALFLGLTGPAYIAMFFYRMVFKNYGAFPEDEDTENGLKQYFKKNKP